MVKILTDSVTTEPPSIPTVQLLSFLNVNLIMFLQRDIAGVGRVPRDDKSPSGLITSPASPHTYTACIGFQYLQASFDEGRKGEGRREEGGGRKLAILSLSKPGLTRPHR